MTPFCDWCAPVSTFEPCATFDLRIVTQGKRAATLGGRVARCLRATGQPGNADDGGMALFGEMLRHLRLQRGMSLAELGRAVHYNKGYLSRIETSQRVVSEPLLGSATRSWAREETSSRPPTSTSRPRRTLSRRTLASCCAGFRRVTSPAPRLHRFMPWSTSCAASTRTAMRPTSATKLTTGCARWPER